MPRGGRLSATPKGTPAQAATRGGQHLTWATDDQAAKETAALQAVALGLQEERAKLTPFPLVASVLFGEPSKVKPLRGRFANLDGE